MTKINSFEINNQAKLTCEIKNDGIIYLSMGGNLTEDTLDKFVEWSDDVKKAMKTAYKNNPNNVLTLIDAKGTNEIDTSTIKKLYDLMSYNKKYVTKTAVFGTDYFATIIVEMALHVTKRRNMKIFKTREEAFKWLTNNKK